MAKKKKKRSGGRKGRGLFGAAGRGALSAGIGAGAYYAQKLASENSEWIRDNWWAPALVTFGLGTLVGTKSSKMAQQIAASLSTAAGYSAAMGYSLQSAGADVGAVFEPEMMMSSPVERQIAPPAPRPQVVETVVVEDDEAAAEAAAVYPPRGPYNHFRRPRPNYGRFAA